MIRASHKGNGTQGCFGRNTVWLGNTFLQQKDQGHNSDSLEVNLPFQMSDYTGVPLIAGFKVSAFCLHLPVGNEEYWGKYSLRNKGEYLVDFPRL